MTAQHKQVLPTAEWLTADRVREITRLIVEQPPPDPPTSPEQEASG